MDINGANVVLRVFYSWQSDLIRTEPTSPIRSALRSARAAVEKKFKHHDLTIELDEATRNEAGSPNIPATLLAKIAACDVLVADVTIVNSADTSGSRKMPNPNVVFELGYGVAKVGWNRVILLCNESFGSVKDLPFDFDRHRVSTFRLEPGQSSSGLEALLCQALETIIAKAPPKPSHSFSAEAETRKRDVRTMGELLKHIHWPTLRLHIEDAPKIVRSEIFDFWEHFRHRIGLSTYVIYDPRLSGLIANLGKHWGASLAHGSRYEQKAANGYYMFTYSAIPAQREREEAEWDQINEELVALDKAMRTLAAYLKEQYIELDLEELEEAAWMSHCARLN
jgi:hypothetical protein